MPVLIAALTAAVFGPAIGFPFLNWDDQYVFALNEGLRAPGVIVWALTTRYMEHYQPAAWLTWAAVDRTVGLTAASAHALNVGLHAACAALVYSLGRRVLGDWRTAALAALVWALHPLRVEVVAWASAMPYALALLFALLATRAWVDGRSWAAVGWLTASLAARPVALGLPFVFLALPVRRRGAALAGIALAAAFAIAESSARLAASIAEFGVGPRLTLAAAAPWRYLWRTILPAGLTPLDPLALAPAASLVVIATGLGAAAAASVAAWRWRRAHPVLAASWAAYLATLVPAMGFVPSGLQATADRYTYLPAVPLSIAVAYVVAMAASRAPRWMPVFRAAAAAVVLTLAVITWQQTQYWRDSIALWTRAVEIDRRNDVALYNLGTALAVAGRRDEALARYEQVLAIVPGHAGAARNRDLLRAEALESEGNRLAANRELAAAADAYAAAVRLDPKRTHARAALGMALTELGRLAEARPHLQAALGQGESDPAVPNALAYVLAQSGERDAALAVLREARRRHPADPNIARNLAMLEGGR